MKRSILSSFSDLTKGERVLYALSLIGVVLSYLIPRLCALPADPISTIASLIGVTALIFVAKGYLLGQLLTLIFAVFYGAVSLSQQYYGEMITYLGITAPMAVLALVSWMKYPYRNSKEVTVARLSGKKLAIVIILSIVVTVAFYFILAALQTASLLVSTISVTTSFFAASLTFLRSPYYALAYAANDVVLILLWSIASLSDPSYLPMLVCFFLFLANDLYGYVNWKRMQSRQSDSFPGK